MKYVSLGRHCDVAFNIKKYNTNSPSFFFDWARIDFKCCLYILKLNNIETFLNKENIIVDKQMFSAEKEICFKFKNFDENNNILYFHHENDVEQYDATDVELDCMIDKFINKYTKRFIKMVNLICSEEEIIFIYRDTDNIFKETYVNEFIDCIFKINKNVVFCLIILTEDNDDFLYIKKKNYLKINISKFINYDLVEYDDWTIQKYDWVKIFNIITNNK
jgi:hypothetical protein